MSVLKESLISILKQSNSIHLCQSVAVECSGIGCTECPLNESGSLDTLIKELESEND